MLSLFLLTTSCNSSDQESKLKDRETALMNKEQEFLKKEQDYESLKAMRDSLEHSNDTVVSIKIPENIIGKWNGKMICSESSCSENVIGDQRNDLWEFDEDGVKIINKSGGERMYSGKLINSEIRLVSENNASANNQSEITLQLSESKTGRMRGIRMFFGNNCTSKFSVELEKINN